MKRLLLVMMCAMFAISASAQNRNVEFQGYANVGTTFFSLGAGPTFDVNAGVRIHDYFYIGAEAGFHALLIPFNFSFGDTISVNTTAYMLTVPLGINLKGYFTKGHKFTPYVNASAGGFIEVTEGGGGGFCQAGLGFDYKRFAFGAGYHCMIANDSYLHMGYLKLGIRFGNGGKYW